MGGREISLAKKDNRIPKKESAVETELVPLTKKYSTVHLTLTFSCWPESPPVQHPGIRRRLLRDADWRRVLRAPPLSLNTQSSDTRGPQLVPDYVRTTACPIQTHQQGSTDSSTAPENWRKASQLPTAFVQCCFFFFFLFFFVFRYKQGV